MKMSTIAAATSSPTWIAPVAERRIERGATLASSVSARHTLAVSDAA